MSDDRELALEAWKKNPEVEWNADNGRRPEPVAVYQRR